MKGEENGGVKDCIVDIWDKKEAVLGVSGTGFEESEAFQVKKSSMNWKCEFGA
jgi:hypothetical protein